MEKYIVNQNYTFLTVPTKVVKSKDISDSEKLILSLMIGYYRKYDNIQLSVDRIADELGYCEKTVRNNISKLIEKNLVKLIPVCENNLKKCNQYEVNFQVFNDTFGFDYFVLAGAEMEEGVENKKGFSTSSKAPQNNKAENEYWKELDRVNDIILLLKKDNGGRYWYNLKTKEKKHLTYKSDWLSAFGKEGENFYNKYAIKK